MAENCNYCSLCAGVVLGPDADELVEVVRAEDGGVPGEVVEVVHDDRHEEVEHDEGAKGGQFNTLVMVYNAQLITPNLGSLDILEKFLRPGLYF